MRRAAISLLVVLVGGALTWWAAGDRIRALWPRLIQPLSPHERYGRALERADLHDTVLGRAWAAAAARALQHPRTVTPPFSEVGLFDPAAPAAEGFRFSVVRGRRIEVEVEVEGTGEVFVDLFRLEANRPPGADVGAAGEHEPAADLARVASAAAGTHVLHYEPAEAGSYVLRVQPELLGGGQYTVRQRSVATLRFPVQGASPRAVHSGFGDARDRGARFHEGVDIFAPRGTPALAATDGWVTRVTTNRLGGNVVWVWDAERGQALYYAHLDRQDVAPGTRVASGDVVGLIGNTGNARTTPPHLHFGIYRPLEGAIDPLPFICDAPCGASGMAYAR